LGRSHEYSEGVASVRGRSGSTARDEEAPQGDPGGTQVEPMSTGHAYDPVLDGPPPQIVTHHIGDVTCILMVPADCPVPHVSLSVYPHGTPDERAVAVSALGLSGVTTRSRKGSIWRDRETDGWRATVFMLPGDEDAQVAA
jgi:hypothetical protein